MLGPLLTAPSITSNAGFNISVGVAPTSPNNGDMWVTGASIFARINGTTYDLIGSPCLNCALTTVANTFTASPQTVQGLTTTQPGWYAQITGDTFPRVRVGLNSTDVASIAFGSGSAARDNFIERLGPNVLAIDSMPVSVPNQTNFLGSAFIFSNPASLSHVSGNDGQNNTVFGYQALQSATTGYNNVAIGFEAGFSTTTGANIAIGPQALFTTTAGVENVAIGQQALQLAQTTSLGVNGDRNVGIGWLALQQDTNGQNNVGIGFWAGLAGTTGSNNVSVGREALVGNQTGGNNVALGGYSMHATSPTNINGNVAVGFDSLNVISSDNNVAVGNQAGFVMTSGGATVPSVAMGAFSLFTVSSGYGNVAVGYEALTLATGNANTVIGSVAGASLTTGSNNTIIGGATGFAAGLNSNVVLSDGGGNIRLQFNSSGQITNALTMNAGLTSPIYAASGALTFETNGTTFAGSINASQQWYFGPTNNTVNSNNGPLTVSKNAAAVASSAAPLATAVATLINADNVTTELAIQSFGSGNPRVAYYGARGTAASPTASTSGNAIGANFAWAYATSSSAGYVTTAGAGFVMSLTETTCLTTACGESLQLLATPTGSVTQQVEATVQNGIVVGNATGGSKGLGTINISGAFYANGVAVAGTGTVTSVACGTGLTCSPSPINGSGTITNAGVTSIAGNAGAFTLSGGITNSTNAIKLALNNAVLQATTGNPSATSSSTQVMMGVGSTCTITPVYSTRVHLIFQGNVLNSNSGDTVITAARYGTGTAPTNGAASTGTAVGSTITTLQSGANYQSPISFGGVITGLTPGTAYWFDIGLNQISGGSAAISNISCTAIEF
jgi:hypothetical protein